ncbi:MULTISPECIES: 5-deoxy-glucuronate isomerase [unclassified Aeromicrobium]|jgi:5-deoxy-glucuronate isomerase|uniref:5-deoxy-glucuronate isomerase n=1 Tax=unclassified Aeromicrobium TaxID=2633570 RepID=UPI000A474DE8|nr:MULTISPECIES: 5-deoxy-glucuronate isomerase [unclassified Aeromicrobium]
MSHVVRKGEGAVAPFVLDVTPKSAGWDHTGLKVLELAPGASQTVTEDGHELLVLALSGSATVVVDVDGAQTSFDLAGRPDVWSGPSDVVYAPLGSAVTVTSAAGGRFAIPTAAATARLEPAYLPAADVPVEMRGAGQASRQVNNFGVPGVLEADRIIACEVLTPGGNWSSYPPHKHDEEREGETRLEEIYYYEVASGPAPAGVGGDGPQTERPGVGYQRVYGHEKAEIDVLAEVRDGDVVLIPHGWHGPSMAAPGYDLYYLNVMAGPGDERAWLICDDPAHTWVRDTWADQPVDPRLPFGGHR